MLSLLLCFEDHAKTLVKFLKTAHVLQEISADQFGSYVPNLMTDNGLGFFDADLTQEGEKSQQGLVRLH